MLSAADVDRLATQDLRNIVHVDVPLGGDDRYHLAGQVLRRWIDTGVMVADPEPSFTIYRMSCAAADGTDRQVVGVLGALEVVDEGSGGVLPYARTTLRARTDRLDLMKQTMANTSPVWGLSLARGVTDLLRAPGTAVAEVTRDAVTHRVERVTDADRLAAISARVAGADVILVDGHDRYSAARKYRDCMRIRTQAHDGAAEYTLAFTCEVGQNQFSINAVHRLYRGTRLPDLVARLEVFFDTEPVSTPDAALLGAMVARGRLVLLDAQGRGTWLIPKPGAFDEVPALDGSWLEHVMAGCATTIVSYQHGLGGIRRALADGAADAAILTRPTGISEIQRAAQTGMLMPPKSMLFTPTLLTGLVIRDLVTTGDPV